MAPKDEEAPEAVAPDPNPEPVLSTLQGAAYPTVNVHAEVSVRNLKAGETGAVPDDDETRALIAAGRLVRV